MSDDNKCVMNDMDRKCPPCINCGEELYEKYWGNGGWSPTSYATERTHFPTDCTRKLAKDLQTERTRRHELEHLIARIVELYNLKLT